jgi:hypothetical protein
MTENRYALLLNTSIEEAHRTANALGYAVDLAGAGHEVRVYLDGPATQWPGYLLRDPGGPVAEPFKQAHDRGLVAGACRRCAEGFGTVDSLRRAGTALLGDGDDHEPDAGALAAEGFDLLAF